MELDSEKTNGEGIAYEAIRVYSLVKGLPYIYGGKTTKGFDCSGFVAHVFGNLFPQHKILLQTNVDGFIKSSLFEKVETPITGDLIVFPATARMPNHIGIVVSEKQWIGSQSSTGVAPVNIEGSWWSKNRSYYFIRYKSSSAHAVISAFRGKPNVALV